MLAAPGEPALLFQLAASEVPATAPFAIEREHVDQLPRASVKETPFPSLEFTIIIIPREGGHILHSSLP